MEKHEKNGLKVARFLESHPMVRKVLHAGLPSHPQHELAKKQSSGFSGMVSFFIQGSSEEAREFLRNVKLFTLAVSLGSVESLIELPARMSHASVPREHLKAIGVDDTLIRLSVGIENHEDLINDLSRALEKAAVVYAKRSKAEKNGI